MASNSFHEPTRGGAMKLIKALVAALAILGSAPAFADAYPSRLIKIVVPFPPGGSTDVIARSIAEKFQKSMGQTTIVENRPGAGGAVGSDHVAKQPADGYTLLVGVTGSH